MQPEAAAEADADEAAAAAAQATVEEAVEEALAEVAAEEAAGAAAGAAGAAEPAARADEEAAEGEPIYVDASKVRPLRASPAVSAPEQCLLDAWQEGNACCPPLPATCGNRAQMRACCLM